MKTNVSEPPCSSSPSWNGPRLQITKSVGLEYRPCELEVSAPQEAIDGIVLRGAGDPRATMLIARETVSIALSRRRDLRVDYGDVLGGWELAMQAHRLRHEKIVERLRSSAHAYRIALRVARGGHPYSGTAPQRPGER